MLALVLLAMPEHVAYGHSPSMVLGGYFTVEETELLLRDMAARYPHLATLVDFGDSWERGEPDGAPGYDLLALRITSRRHPGPKPVFTLVAAIHANELAGPEVATRFASMLLAGYGVDPTLTWLLDGHEVVVVPIFNPDGRALAQPTRKSTSAWPDTTCRGVDLNRNFPYEWGAAAASPYPCSDTYLGPTPASEPETRAMMALLENLYATRATPPAGQPFPDETSGVLVSLHTYGDLVLWPWAHTSALAPNAPGLERLGRSIAARNGYSPKSAFALYPHAGRLDDWAYATLGVAAFTIEIGSVYPCSGHSAPFTCIDDLFWPQNRGALVYAALVASTPYTLAFGPTFDAASVTGDTANVTVSARASAVAGGVAAAELYIGEGPPYASTPLAMVAADGAFGGAVEEVRVTVPRELLAGDVRPLLIMRASSTTGAWGPFEARWAPAPDAPGPAYRLVLPLLAR